MSFWNGSKARPSTSAKAFSLIELVVVVVIIGIIAAIAIPKMSKGAQGASDSAVAGDLALIRQAIDMYANEHGGALPSATNIASQLTQFSNSDGSSTATTKDTGTNQIVLGPYIRAIPPLPVGSSTLKGTNGIGSANTYAWVYDATTGIVTANPSVGNDAAGNPYSGY